MTAQTVSFVVVPLGGDITWEVLKKWPSSALAPIITTNIIIIILNMFVYFVWCSYDPECDDLYLYLHLW